MAASTLPAPGTKAGPCKTVCAHTDCAATRQMAAMSCAYCTGAIGYETPFYNIAGPGDDMKLAHAACHEKEAANV